MRRLQSGETAAFNSLFDRYRRFVFRLVLGIVVDPKLSEDITQTVFLKLWASPTSYRNGSLPRWLFQVSRNCAIDELRRRKMVEELPPIASDEVTPFERVAAALDAQRLHAALAALSNELRFPIELNFFTGLTHGQIAAHMCIPLGTVKTRIRSGLKSLRYVLADRPQLPTNVSMSQLRR